MPLLIQLKNRTPPRTNILPASALIMSLFRKYISEEKNKLLAKQPALSGTSDDSECPVRQAVSFQGIVLSPYF